MATTLPSTALALGRRARFATPAQIYRWQHHDANPFAAEPENTLVAAEPCPAAVAAVKPMLVDDDDDEIVWLAGPPMVKPANDPAYKVEGSYWGRPKPDLLRVLDIIDAVDDAGVARMLLEVHNAAHCSSGRYPSRKARSRLMLAGLFDAWRNGPMARNPLPYSGHACVGFEPTDRQRAASQEPYQRSLDVFARLVDSTYTNVKQHPN